MKTVQLILIALILFCSSVAKAQFSNDKYLSLSLIADQTQVQGGETITLGVVQKLYPKWHVYWQNPGDSGEPARLKWQGLDNATFHPIQWPVPEKLPMGPLTNYGYEDEVTLLQEVTLPATLPTGPVSLSLDANILVCADICIPEHHTATLILNGNQSANPNAIEKAKTHLPRKTDWTARYTSTGSKIALHIQHSEPLNLRAPSLFFTQPGLVDNTAKATVEKTSDGIVLYQKRGDLEARTIPQSGAVIVDTNRNAFAVDATFSSSLTLLEAQKEESRLAFSTALLFALLGGLILNLMPCVFPILSLKIFGLVQMKGGERHKARLHGIAYTLGVVVSFLSIAGILIALKAGGAQIGWGFQLQNPVVIVLLTYLTVLLGLNLGGFFELGNSFSNVGSSLAQKEGASGSFFTGVLATLVATPCTAPFMGAAMGYALVQPPQVSLSIFAALGFGLALPYLLFSFVPALHVLLPKPGNWMVRFKEFLAFPMFATAAWLVWVLSQQSGSSGVFFVLMGLTVLSLGIWWLKHSASGSAGRILAIFVILLSLSPLYLVFPTGDNITNHSSFSPETYSEALRSKDPVFVNMTAAWCITCKVNERVALNTQATRTLFKEMNIHYLKGDWTNFNADITQYLEKYQRSGVPLYVFYPAPKDGQRPAPVVLPQVLTTTVVHEQLTQNQP